MVTPMVVHDGRRRGSARTLASRGVFESQPRSAIDWDWPEVTLDEKKSQAASHTLGTFH